MAETTDRRDNPQFTVIEKAVGFLRLCEEAETENRNDALDDVRFRDGKQWPADIQTSRELEKRPCLTINKTDSYCTQVENQQRQQRPRIKVDPVGGGATKKVADVIQGLIRHIENNKGGGDLAYDNGFSTTLTGGFGYWRVLTEYCRDDSREQELYLSPVENQFSVYFDPSSIWPDGQDGEECLITEMTKKHTFRRQYPGADDGANFIAGSLGEGYNNWLNAEEIRVAEYYVIERTPAVVWFLSNGKSMWDDRRPENAPTGALSIGMMIAPGLFIIDSRKSMRKQLKWYKLTALDVLETRDLPGRFLPVIPLYGKTSVVDGKRKRKGLVRNAKDPARNFNFWRTAMTESVALGPKAKWLIIEGQDEGHESEWANANTNTAQTLRYKQTDIDGVPAERPSRIQPEMPPDGVMIAAQAIGDDLSAVLGIVDPAIRIGGNVSGKALNAERQQSDNATFNFFDNMTRSMAQTGRVLLDLIPHYYAEPGRIARILGDDGRAKSVTLNEPNPSPGKETPGPEEEIINDVTVGEYAVVMDTGPGYSTKRQEAVAYMAPMFEKNEKLMEIAGDLLFRNMDGPGADVIADRLAAANPLAQIDEKSEVPPSAQMKIKQQAQQIEQMGQAIQQLQMEIKVRGGVEQMRQDGATKRELIKTTAAVHIEDQENIAWAHDVAVKSQTALSVAEINAVRELLKTGVNNAHDLVTLERVAAREDAQTSAKGA